MVIRSHLSVVADLSRPVDGPLVIDCDECAAQDTEQCVDCVVSHVVGREPGRPVEFDRGEANAVRLLSDAGLLPGSRFRRQQPVA